MHATTQATIDKLVTNAEHDRRCIICSDKTLGRELARLAKAGELVSTWRGMYASPEVWNELKPTEKTRRIVRTLAQKYPDWTFCEVTAALMHGLEVTYQDLLPLHVAVTNDCRSRSSKMIRRHPMTLVDAVEADGVRVTALKQTVLDCLSELDFKRALAIADSALRVGGMTKDELENYIKGQKDCRGRDRALEVVAWANPLAANGGESVARASIIEQGFMVPDLQVAVPNVIEGGEPYYADFMWNLADGTRVAGELDGLDKYVDPKMTGGKSVARVMSNERRRESRLGAANIRVMRFSYAEVEDADKFWRILTAYGIPRGPARPHGKVGKG